MCSSHASNCYCLPSHPRLINASLSFFLCLSNVISPFTLLRLRPIGPLPRLETNRTNFPLVFQFPCFLAFNEMPSWKDLYRLPFLAGVCIAVLISRFPLQYSCTVVDFYLLHYVNGPVLRRPKWSEKFRFLIFQTFLIFFIRVQVSDPGISGGRVITLCRLNYTFLDIL